MHKEYKIGQTLQPVLEYLNEDLFLLNELLIELGFNELIIKRTKELRIFCPNCQPQGKADPGLSIKFKNRAVKWNCYGCGIQSKKFDNLIGLYRIMFDEDNPWAAVNIMFDHIFTPKGKSTLRFPIDVESYKGKLLSDVPAHKIYWTAIHGNISEHHKEMLFNYLGGRLFPREDFK